MIIQWKRQKDGAYVARWSGIDFLLSQDPATKFWSVTADGRHCTTNGKVRTWKSSLAAVEKMDEIQTALLMKKTATRLDVRPFMDKVADAAESLKSQGLPDTYQVNDAKRTTLFVRPEGEVARRTVALLLEAQAVQARAVRPTLTATVADGPRRIATALRRSGLPPMTPEERALVVQRAAHQTKQASNA
jgi:hypothetical protein